MKESIKKQLKNVNTQMRLKNKSIKKVDEHFFNVFKIFTFSLFLDYYRI